MAVLNEIDNNNQSSSDSSSSSSCSSSSSSCSDSESSDEDCEDIIGDPAFIPEQEHDFSDECQSTEENVKQKGRKRICNVDKWKKNVTKRLRNSGKSYQMNSKTGKIANARKMKPPYHLKCRLKCSQKLQEHDRQQIFSNYWNMGSLEKQRQFIASCIEKIQPKYQYTKENRRKFNSAFYFNIKGNKFRVCKLFFKNTLDINDRPIRTVIAKKDEYMNDLLEEDRRGKHGHHVKKDEEMRKEIRTFIASIPKVESHYRRSESSRHYIEGNKFITDLHRDYVAKCKEKIYHFVIIYYFIQFLPQSSIYSIIPREMINANCVLPMIIAQKRIKRK